MKRLWGVKETAECLGIRVSTLRDWVFRRKIPCIKVGKLVKFEPEEIECWISSRRRESIEAKYRFKLMATPQLKNGYVRIANEIIEALCRVNLYPYESRVLWFILRKTYGWQKKMDWIALSQFSKNLGLDRRHVHRTLKGLLAKNMLVANSDDTNHVSYGFQKDYSKWRVSPRKMTVTRRDDSVSPKEVIGLSPKEVPTKDSITKDTITKDIKSLCKDVPDGTSVISYEQYKSEVFNYWVKVMGKEPKRTILDSKREARIKERWEEGAPVGDVRLAIDGCKMSAFHMGDNTGGKLYNDLELILRDRKRLEGFMEIATKERSMSIISGKYSGVGVGATDHNGFKFHKSKQ